MNDYERKIAEKTAKADVRKAVRKWYALGNVSIGEVVKSLGYSQDSRMSMYEYKKTCWTGMESYSITLDTFNLVHGKSEKIDFEVKKNR